jgi:hypothetical protein
LTDLAEQQLAQLSRSHLSELERMRPALVDLLNQTEPPGWYPIGEKRGTQSDHEPSGESATSDKQ